MNRFIFKDTYDILERLILSNIRRKLVAQSVINSFFDGKQADPFAVLGMHETQNGIEIRAL